MRWRVQAPFADRGTQQATIRKKNSVIAALVYAVGKAAEPRFCWSLLSIAVSHSDYGKIPPVNIRAKLSTGKKVIIFWKLFNLLPGTIT